MTVIITRPIQDSVEFANQLRADGFQCIISPVMEIQYHPVIPNLDNVTALAFTSANGVRAFVNLKADWTEEQRAEVFDLPVYAVGPATAQKACLAGFQNVHTAGGDNARLADLIISKIGNNYRGALVYHGAGSDRRGDLVSLLEQANLGTRREVLYQGVPIQNLSNEAYDALSKMRGDHKQENFRVVFFSPRSARLFMKQIQRAGLIEHLSQLEAYCLSQAIAKTLMDANTSDLSERKSWKIVRTAAKPEIDSLRDLLTP